jgi:AraC-like DNA-binding protein
MGDHFQKSNVLIHLQKGDVFVGKEADKLEKGAFYFLPVGQPITIKHGLPPYHDLGEDGFYSQEEVTKYLRFVQPTEDRTPLRQVYSLVAFDLSLFNAIPFFEVLDMPAFSMPPDDEFGTLLMNLASEFHLKNLGRDKIIKSYIEQVVIYLCRYIDSCEAFKPNIEKLEFLSDRRLVDIVTYIQANLGSDLSNKIIANIAYVSEDYVGQFFKSLTKKNLQDYIENQRLDRAMLYLRTEPDNIQEIAHRVGFKDPAYFSRRFKMRYGFNANSIRSQQSPLI